MSTLLPIQWREVPRRQSTCPVIAQADTQGFKQASDAWRARIARSDINAAALANAAYYFKLSDKAFTISLLERAVILEPANTAPFSVKFKLRLGPEELGRSALNSPVSRGPLY